MKKFLWCLICLLFVAPVYAGELKGTLEEYRKYHLAFVGYVQGHEKEAREVCKKNDLVAKEEVVRGKYFKCELKPGFSLEQLKKVANDTSVRWVEPNFEFHSDIDN